MVPMDGATDSRTLTAARAGRRAAPGALPAALFERSDLKGFLRLSMHASLLACTLWLVSASRETAVLLPALVLHGLVLIFLFAPLHECIHATAFKRRRWNDVLAFVCGFVLLLPREYFRAFHLAHHRHTQDPERDPELALRKPQTTGQYLLHLSGLPYWRERLTTLVRHARGNVTEPFIAESKRALIAQEARRHLALYAGLVLISLVAQSEVLLVYWVVPALLGQPFLRGFLLAEHAGCPYVSDMFLNTRTTVRNRAARLLTWNMPYHAEHHAWAAVPFHALPQVHDIVKDRLGCQADGYLSFHRKLWRSLKSAT